MTTTKSRAPEIIKGKHLTVTKYKNGNVSLEWDWVALLKEVQIATGDRTVQYVDVGDLSPQEAVALLKDVETKVTKSRAKKADEQSSPSVGKNAKKAPAKKATTKTKK